jgi:GTP-binding protein SAR1
MMFVLSWIRTQLEIWGLLRKNARILFLGLDNAGKTTLLGRLKDDRMVTQHPTTHPTSEEFQLGNLRITTFDLGGHVQIRKIWNSYFPTADGIVFVVDASVPARLPEARNELTSLLTCESLMKTPILVLGNKIDMTDTAVSEETMVKVLGLRQQLTGKSTGNSFNKGTRPVEVYMCSVLCRQGYGEGLVWLTHYL